VLGTEVGVPSSIDICQRQVARYISFFIAMAVYFCWLALLIILCTSYDLQTKVDAWVPQLLSHKTSLPTLGYENRMRYRNNRVSLSLPTSSFAEEEMPFLLSLYDTPPRLDEYANKTNNDTTPSSTNSSVGDDDQGTADWVTEVTSGTLSTEEVSSHILYYEVHHRYHQLASKVAYHNNNQKKKKLTALFLHGGPGAGCNPNHVRFFSPELYDTVILLDQRGCGKSVPLGETQNNTLELLVNDVERLRVHVLDDKPYDIILGGSWGCTLATAYAHSFPNKVNAMVLRGICLFRPKEIDWLFGDPLLKNKNVAPHTSNLKSLLLGNKDGAKSTRLRGSGSSVIQMQESTNLQTTEDESTTLLQNTASLTFPNGWKEFVKGSSIVKIQKPPLQSENIDLQTPNKSSRSILHRYYNMLLGSDPLIRFTAVKSWFQWEMGIYSSGFAKEKTTSQSKISINNTVLVWNPTTEWMFEDARVWNNSSVTSINSDSTDVGDERAQSLRRFSSTPTGKTRVILEPIATDPIPIYPLISSNNLIPNKPTASNKKTSNNSTFDPTTYIPAQSMLTCYFSTNDNYCIGPYRSFMSLSPPSSIPFSSWYSSQVPPTVKHPEQGSLKSNFPLPPTIAIQGGNDAICPPDTALDLHNVWKEMELRIVLESGHSMYDSVIAGEIVKALDRFGHSLIKNNIQNTSQEFE